MQQWTAIKVPFDVKRGEIVLFSPSSGELIPVLTPDFAKESSVAIQVPPKTEATIHTLPLQLPLADPPASALQRPGIKPEKSKKTCVHRPADRLHRDREETLRLIANHPAGIPVLKIAEIIHSVRPNQREKSFATDDVRWLVKQGLIKRYSRITAGGYIESVAKPA